VASRPSEATRLGQARQRTRLAKVLVGVVGLAGFGASAVLARVTYQGHTKRPVHPLSIPQPLYLVVRQNLLQAGILAPATAPPDASTSTS
jgi:hypothetical protein